MRSYLAHLVAEQPSPHPHDGRKVAKDGTILDIRTDWTYRFDSNHQVDGFIAVITDRSSEGRPAELEDAPRSDGEESRRERTPSTLQRIREDLDALHEFARTALRDGDSTDAARERVFRMLRRLQRTTDTALRQQNAEATDTEPHSN